MESLLVCSPAQTGNVQVAAAGAASPPGPTLVPAPGNKALGLFLGISFSPFQDFPPVTFISFYPKFLQVLQSTDLAMTDFFFPPTNFFSFSP